jgi:hypothetical protein
MGGLRKVCKLLISQLAIILANDKGSGQEAGRRGAERGEPCRVCELWGAVSCRSSDPQWWRTELDLSSGKSFDDRHRSATLGATPKRLRFLGGGGLWFDLRRNCAQCCPA